MFDPLYGVQADGIKKAVIRNDMISDTANISGKKIDISSLITTINSDGSSTLNASKIYVDTDKQTLDVSFKNLTTNVSTALSKANTLESYPEKLAEAEQRLETVQEQMTRRLSILSITL